MPKFDARAYLEVVQRERIIHTMLVPVQYNRIMDVPDFDDFDLSSMRVNFSTSAPLRADVKQDVLARFPGKLLEYYGLTEGGGVRVLAAHEYPDKLHTVGKLAPGNDIRLIDSEGREVPQGEVGEICGRGPTMMTGYYGRDDLTADYIWRDAEGRIYFRSGDMGSFDEDGVLVLLDDPDVTDAAVISVSSEAWGETPLGLPVFCAQVPPGRMGISWRRPMRGLVKATACPASRCAITCPAAPSAKSSRKTYVSPIGKRKNSDRQQDERRGKPCAHPFGQRGRGVFHQSRNLRDAFCRRP